MTDTGPQHETSHDDIMEAVRAIGKNVARVLQQQEAHGRQIEGIHRQLADGEHRFNEQDKALLFQNSAIQAGQQIEHAAAVIREGLDAVRKSTLRRLTPAEGTQSGPDEDTNPGNPKPDSTPTMPAPAPESGPQG